MSLSFQSLYLSYDKLIFKFNVSVVFPILISSSVPHCSISVSVISYIFFRFFVCLFLELEIGSQKGKNCNTNLAIQHRAIIASQFLVLVLIPESGLIQTLCSSGCNCRT